MRVHAVGVAEAQGAAVLCRDGGKPLVLPDDGVVKAFDLRIAVEFAVFLRFQIQPRDEVVVAGADLLRAAVRHHVEGEAGGHDGLAAVEIRARPRQLGKNDARGYEDACHLQRVVPEPPLFPDKLRFLREMVEVQLEKGVNFPPFVFREGVVMGAEHVQAVQERHCAPAYLHIAPAHRGVHMGNVPLQRLVGGKIRPVFQDAQPCRGVFSVGRAQIRLRQRQQHVQPLRPGLPFVLLRHAGGGGKMVGASPVHFPVFIPEKLEKLAREGLFQQRIGGRVAEVLRGKEKRAAVEDKIRKNRFLFQRFARIHIIPRLRRRMGQRGEIRLSVFVVHEKLPPSIDI